MVVERDACPPSDDNAEDAQDDDDGHGVINCNGKCLGVDDVVFGSECEGAKPAASEWGLIVPAPLLMAGGKLFCKFGVERGIRC